MASRISRSIALDDHEALFLVKCGSNYITEHLLFEPGFDLKFIGINNIDRIHRDEIHSFIFITIDR